MEDCLSMEYNRLNSININDNVGQRVFVIGMIADVEIKKQKDGVTRYLQMNLCDKNNKVKVSKFGATDNDIELLVSGRVIAAGVDLKEYKGQTNGVIYNYEMYNADTSDFLDWAEGRDWAANVINESINMLNGSIYYNLVYGIITDHWESFKKWSAASSFHHNKLGGLLVHTAEVVDGSIEIAKTWQKRYGDKFVNMPLLISASILHDIGKLYELSIDEGTGVTDYTTNSALEPHITKGVDIVVRKAIQLGIGENVAGKTEEQVTIEREAIDVLKHCILAHHGKKEWGSPIEPNCPEAYILNKADEISAAMFRFNADFKKMKSGTSLATWTSTGMLVTYKDLTK